jgi:hypothetical protein
VSTRYIINSTSTRYKRRVSSEVDVDELIENGNMYLTAANNEKDTRNTGKTYRIRNLTTKVKTK